MESVDISRGSCRLRYPEHWIEVPLDQEHLDHSDPEALLRTVADRLDRLDQIDPEPPANSPPEGVTDGAVRGQVGAATPNLPPKLGLWTEERGRVAGAPANLPPEGVADGAVRGQVRMGDGEDRDAERRVLVGLIVAVLADDSAQGALLGAHRYEYDPRFGHVHAHLAMGMAERRRPDSLAAELAALLDLARSVDGAMEEPEVTEVSLPQAGRGLRVRYLEAERLAEATRSEPNGDLARTAGNDLDDLPDIYAVLLDTVTYLVPVPDTPHCVWLRFWTPHLAMAERLVEEFDGIAHTLEVDPGGRN